jgi:hypothetical protein
MRPQLTTRRRKVTREISVETTEAIFIRRSGNSTSAWCSECQMKTEMLSLEDAALAMGVTTRSVRSWIDSGRVHFSEGQPGIFRVCVRSLSLLSPAFLWESKP